MFQKNGSRGSDALLQSIFDLLLKQLHLRGHDPSGHTHTATHANGTASNGPDGASAVQRRAILYKETLDPSHLLVPSSAFMHESPKQSTSSGSSAPLGFIYGKVAEMVAGNDHQV